MGQRDDWNKKKLIKKYYRITFELTSPLTVGNGESYVTDRDIVRDSRGVPYIPGSSLAGIYRSLFSSPTDGLYFGAELTSEKIEESSAGGKNVLTESRIVVYDAQMEMPSQTKYGKETAKRDMVALDEYKTAIPGAKFDFEVLEPGVRFVTYIEQNMDSPDQQYVINEIAHAWMRGRIAVGAKTERGYGHTKGIRAESAMYELDNAEQLEDWLAFDMYADEWEGGCTAVDCDDSCLGAAEPSSPEYDRIKGACLAMKIFLAEEEKRTVRLRLAQRGGISIRQYTTNVDEEDYRQLTTRPVSGEERENGAEGTPVVPGTSWAGAFRAQMGRLDPGFGKGQPSAELFFGKARGQQQEKSGKSRIGFSESRITGGKWVAYTRNAIDRFTGGTVEGALYSEKTYYNGETELTITCDFSDRGEGKVEEQDRRHLARVLSAAVLDLDAGYTAVGGLTAVGRGMFRVEQIAVDEKLILDRKAGQSPEPEEIFAELVKAIAGEEER